MSDHKYNFDHTYETFLHYLDGASGSVEQEKELVRQLNYLLEFSWRAGFRAGYHESVRQQAVGESADEQAAWEKTELLRKRVQIFSLEDTVFKK